MVSKQLGYWIEAAAGNFVGFGAGMIVSMHTSFLGIWVKRDSWYPLTCLSYIATKWDKTAKHRCPLSQQVWQD